MVCLGLTCRQLHTAVLGACNVERLEQICPRDVRTRLPKILLPYNTLGWEERRNVFVVENEMCPRMLYLLVELNFLAYIRTAAWCADSETNVAVETYAAQCEGYDLSSETYRLLLSMEWRMLAHRLHGWMGMEYRYCEWHGGWRLQSFKLPFLCPGCLRIGVAQHRMPGAWVSEADEELEEDEGSTY